MCGIFGIASRRLVTDKDYFLPHFEAGLKAISNRGPDDTGFVSLNNESLWLGHTRLSIHDLTEAGHQPMESFDKSVTMAFNGEAYNFRSLRSLVSSGSDRNLSSTASDTRVVVECIATKGIEWTIKHIDGMFSLASWNHVNDSLHLIRDFHGEKPLFYFLDKGDLWFSSDILAFPNEITASRYNNRLIPWFLKFGYIPDAESIFGGIRQVKPGTELILRSDDRGDWFIKETIDHSKDLRIDSIQMGYDKYPLKLDFLESSLRNSVFSRISSDVPVGLFLSGGVDSTLIASFMKEYRETFPCFTVAMSGFGDLDESSLAQLVAGHLGFEHHILSVNDIDFCSTVQDLLLALGQPFGDSSVLPTMALSKFAKETVGVVLTGDGGDELFGGYNRHVYASSAEKYAEVIKRIPWLIDEIEKDGYVASVASSFLNLKKSTLLRNVGKLRNLVDGSESFISQYVLIASDPHVEQFLNVGDYRLDFNENLKDKYLNEISLQYKSLVDLTMFLDQNLYLSSDILFKSDFASMRYGLEARAPFLSNEVSNVAKMFSFNELVKKKLGKQPLREILKKRFARVRLPKEKSGFTLPVASIMRGQLRELANEVIMGIDHEPYLNATEIKRVWCRFIDCDRPSHNEYSEFFWRLFVFFYFKDLHDLK